MQLTVKTARNGVPRRAALRLAAAGLATVGLAALMPAPAARAGEQPLGEGVAGTVLDKRGAPVVGALVVPAPLDRTAGPVPELAVQTDANGRFAWPLGPGRYRIDAIFEGRTVASARVTVVRGHVATARLRAGASR